MGGLFDPTDLPDWSKAFNLTNEYVPVNQLIFIGANTVTTGGTPPTSLTVPVSTAQAVNTQFETLYLVVTTGNTLLTGIETTSTATLSLFGINILTMGPDVINGAVIFTAGPVNDFEPLLFDFVTLVINSTGYLANTSYNFTLYGIRNIRPGVVVQNQTLVIETDGTITTANTWQKVTALAVPSKLTLFQNQGTGNMWIAFSGASAPTGTGLLLLPKGSFTNADVTQVVEFAAGLNVWVKGATAGDPFILWSG